MTQHSGRWLGGSRSRSTFGASNRHSWQWIVLVASLRAPTAAPDDDQTVDRPTDPLQFWVAPATRSPHAFSDMPRATRRRASVTNPTYIHDSFVAFNQDTRRVVVATTFNWNGCRTQHVETLGGEKDEWTLYFFLFTSCSVPLMHHRVSTCWMLH